MLKIDDSRKELIDDNNGEITVVQSFLPKKVLEDPKYNLYAYAENANNQTEFLIKLGEAIDETVANRYKATGHTQNNRMIRIWEWNKGDALVHAELKKRANVIRGYTYESDKEKLNTKEAYRIYSINGFNNFLADVEDIIKEKAEIIRVERQDFPDVEAVVNEVIAIKDKPVVEDLCVRFGKTGAHTLLYKKLEAIEGIKIHVLGSYVGTVKTSYSEEINTLKNNEHCLFIDTDEDLKINYKRIIKHIKAKGNYVVIYLPLTGDADNCFTRRVKLIHKLKSYMMTMTIEEADFGAKCQKQVKKIYSLVNNHEYNFKHFYATTGTNADSWINILGSDVYIIRRDYITDILNIRKEATSIVWNVLDNRYMVAKYGYSSNEMENFDDMFELDDNGHFKNEAYVVEALEYLLRNKLPIIANSRDNRRLVKIKVLNDNAATMLFTPRGNDKHKAIEKLLNRYFPEFKTIILDGNYTTNAEAEKAVTQVIKDNYEQNHNYNVVVISSDMGTRSFSVKQIKNIILMCNSGNPIQKIARGLTYWAEHPEIKCRIADFRLDYTDNNLNSYLGSLAINSLAINATHKSLEELVQAFKDVLATDKLTFNEYFALGENPIREITYEELKYHMQSNTDYRRNLATKVVYEELPLIDLPKDGTSIPEETLNLNAVVNSNLKGDSNRKVKITKKSPEQKANEQKSEQQVDSRILLLNYLLNHKEEFNSHIYANNILKNEFQNNMSEERKQALEGILNIDMHVICQIANILIKHEIDIYN